MVYLQFLATTMISKPKIQLPFRTGEMLYLIHQVLERTQHMTILLIQQTIIRLTLMHTHIKVNIMVINTHPMIPLISKWE